jgi:hypothetical protein
MYVYCISCKNIHFILHERNRLDQRYAMRRQQTLSLSSLVFSVVRENMSSLAACYITEYSGQRLGKGGQSSDCPILRY